MRENVLLELLCRRKNFRKMSSLKQRSVLNCLIFTVFWTDIFDTNSSGIDAYLNCVSSFSQKPVPFLIETKIYKVEYEGMPKKKWRTEKTYVCNVTFFILYCLILRFFLWGSTLISFWLLLRSRQYDMWLTELKSNYNLMKFYLFDRFSWNSTPNIIPC